MRISKTDFMNIVKFNIDGIDKILERNNLISDEDIDKLIELEKEKKLRDFAASAVSDQDSEDDDVVEEVDEKLAMMLPYYNRFEQEVGRIITEKFGGKVLYSEETYKQKKFDHTSDGLNLYCFVDVYQEDDDTIRIFESKATTSSRFSSEKDRWYFASAGEGRKKTRNDFFVLTDNGINVPFEDLGKEFPNGSDYFKRKEKIQDPFDDRGTYLYDLAFQRYVISRSLKTDKKVEYYLVVLNHKYRYDGAVDKDGKVKYSDDLVNIYDMSTIVADMDSVIDNDISFIRANAFNPNIKQAIVERYKESGRVNQDVLKKIFYKEVAEPRSVFNYIGRHHGFTNGDEKLTLNHILFDKGWTKATDVPLDFMNRGINEIQRRAITENVAIYNEEKIDAAINLIKYPVYHLDFETFNCPLPRFANEKPYMQSLFQFSVHIEREPGVCDFEKDNISYLAKNHNDTREELLEALLKAIPIGEGTVLVYNASFERGRLEELQEMFPQHIDHLQNIIDRLFDLLHIVRGNEQLYKELGFDNSLARINNFYHPDQEGSYSLKDVLPVLTDVSYSGLEVYDGTQAMITYANFPTMDEETYKRKYEALLFYCKQDTYAMFEVLRELRKLTK